MNAFGGISTTCLPDFITLTLCTKYCNTLALACTLEIQVDLQKLHQVSSNLKSKPHKTFTFYKPISCHEFLSKPPENIRKPEIL